MPQWVTQGREKLRLARRERRLAGRCATVQDLGDAAIASHGNKLRLMQLVKL